jgi:N,N'-diacetyllegionaminate synthase
MKNKKKLESLGIMRGGKTFIIAEAGINHNGDLGLAFKLVKEAKKAGADAIKFQTYVTEKRVAPGSPIFEVLKKCELSQEQQKRVKEYADKTGILFFSTPFDEASVDFLKSLKVKLIKIASFDIVNEKLLNKATVSGIPLVISRGMANTKEIDKAVKICKKNGTEYALLHCISAYPAPKESVNLNAIKILQKYNCPIGYSDHTLDLDASLYAVAIGACIIEKHFTLDRNMKGPDHKISTNPKELAVLCQKIRELEVMLGSGKITSLPVEKGTRIYRRPSKL